MSNYYFYNETQNFYWETDTPFETLDEYLFKYPTEDNIIIVPQRPCYCHNWANNEWVLDQTLKESEQSKFIRSDRDAKLKLEVDPIVSNPLRWAEMTSEKQTEWAAYRTALLNLPEQEGFPLDITWPTKPE